MHMIIFVPGACVAATMLMIASAPRQFLALLKNHVVDLVGHALHAEAYDMHMFFFVANACLLQLQYQ